jgi:hypothetical protein
MFLLLKLKLLLGYSLLFSAIILHVSHKGHQRQQNLGLEQTFNNVECSLNDEDEVINLEEVAPLNQSSLSIEDDSENDLPQLPWDHHNGGMPPLTQRTTQMYVISLLPTRTLAQTCCTTDMHNLLTAVKFWYRCILTG